MRYSRKSFILDFLMGNFNLGIAEMSIIPKNPVFPNPVLPKTSVPNIFNVGSLACVRLVEMLA